MLQHKRETTAGWEEEVASTGSGFFFFLKANWTDKNKAEKMGSVISNKNDYEYKELKSTPICEQKCTTEETVNPLGGFTHV